jgi:organic hydroperoxide reductase OsmC/OhrA
MTTKQKSIIVTEASRGIGPEELIAATHAECLTMASAFRLQAAGVAQDAELNCRLSGVLRAEITLDVKIV